MKKLVVIGLIILGIGYGFPDVFGSLFGMGKAAYGMSSSDPLGSVAKLNAAALSSGFEGDMGTPNQPRKISYDNNADSKLYPGIKGNLTLHVSDEEYVQKIESSFLGTQHGMSPQRMTPTEAFVIGLWKAAGGPAKPKFERKTETVMSIPWTPKFGKALKLNETFGVAEFESGDVKGTWIYSEAQPVEAIILELK